MWLKLLGAAMLVFCGTMYAERRTREEREQLARFDGFCAVFSHIRSQIEMLCLPLDEIFRRMPPAMLYACGCEGNVALTASPVEMLSRAAAGIADEVAREALEDAVSRLGKGTREDQLRLCGGAVDALTARRKVLAAEAEKKGKSRGVLAVSGCLAVVILLW